MRAWPVPMTLLPHPGLQRLSHQGKILCCGCVAAAAEGKAGTSSSGGGATCRLQEGMACKGQCGGGRRLPR
jgi:hypothetical protein